MRDTANRKGWVTAVYRSLPHACATRTLADRAEDCDAMNPMDRPLYAGLHGVKIGDEQFDFGHGIVLSRTYAHLMAPFLMAFAPAKPGEPHPAPWAPASGGFAYDIYAELYIPRDLILPDWFDRLNTVWWFAALVRMIAAPHATVPVIASSPFSEGAQRAERTEFWPVEVAHKRIVIAHPSDETLTHEQLNWVKKHWLSGGRLMRKSREFNFAFQAFDQMAATANAALYLVALWSALEALFSPAHAELRFRVSALIAVFLEPPGAARLALQKKSAKLYDARSKIVHGDTDPEIDALVETYKLAKRVLTKMIEDNHVPTRKELEASLFGAPVT